MAEDSRVRFDLVHRRNCNLGIEGSVELIGYIAMFFVGGTLGLIGGGGAILTVPIMVYLFNTPAVLATTYSLFVVGISSLFGVWRYHQQNLVDYPKAVNFALPSFVGTYLARRVLMPKLPAVVFQVGEYSYGKDQLVMTIFALVMVGASVSMIRGGKNSGASERRPPSRWLLGTLGLGVGFVAGFVGAGGGFLIIPALVVMASMPMTKAVGTSLLIIAANSLFGFGGDLYAAKEMAWSFLLITTAIALVGIFVGSHAARFVPASRLKPAFGWFVLLMGAYVMLRQLG
jgi:uncharacterized membrane protein YfcA